MSGPGNAGAVSRVGLLAYQAERSSAVLPPMQPELPSLALARPQKAQGQRCGRASLGLVGQEAYRTEARQHWRRLSAVLHRLLLFFLFASPLAAQFELQVVEPAGARIAPSIY